MGPGGLGPKIDSGVRHFKYPIRKRHNDQHRDQCHPWSICLTRAKIPHWSHIIISLITFARCRCLGIITVSIQYSYCLFCARLTTHVTIDLLICQTKHVLFIILDELEIELTMRIYIFNARAKLRPRRRKNKFLIRYILNGECQDQGEFISGL